MFYGLDWAMKTRTFQKAPFPVPVQIAAMKVLANVLSFTYFLAKENGKAIILNHEKKNEEGGS